MRKARSKVTKAFAKNKPGAEGFARLVEEFSLEQEVYAAYQEQLKGRDFYKQNPETQRELICSSLQ